MKKWRERMVISARDRSSGSRVLLLLILVLSLFLRFYKLGSRPLYGDEPFNTVELSQKPLPFLLATNLGSPLYPLLLHVFLPAGDTELWARLPAALFGILSVWAIFVVGRRILGEREAVVAAFLAAVSTSFIYFSQQARAYTIFLFFSLVSLYFFWRAIHEERPSFWIVYGLCQVLGAYAIFFLLVTLPIHGLLILLLVIKKKIPNKTFFYFIFSALAVVGLTFLLYWPTRNTTVSGHVNFFILLKSGLSGLFQGGGKINLVSLISETVKRQLDFSTWPPFFYVKVSLFAVGCGFCLKTKPRAGFLFLSYLILPFVFFSLSNPPSLYWSTQDNKFIFILPVFYLMMARGLTGLDSAAGRTLSKIIKVRIFGVARAAFSGFLILGVVLGEGLYLHHYDFYFWNLRSVAGKRTIETHLKKHVRGIDMAIFDDLPNKADMTCVKPLADSNPSKKRVMIYEVEGDSALIYQARGSGLWIIMDRPPSQGESLSRLLAVPGAASFCPSSGLTFFYLPGGATSLADRLVPAFAYLAETSGQIDRKIQYHLMRAKLRLLAENLPDALKEIESVERLKSGPAPQARDRVAKNRLSRWTTMLLFPKRMTVDDCVQDRLCQQTADLLIDFSESSLNRRDAENAVSLLAAAKRLHPRTTESSPRFHQLSAECAMQRGARAEALEDYRRALLLCRNEDDVMALLIKMREGLSLPSGLILWQNKNVFELRWWSEEKSFFTGTLASSLPIKKVEGIRLGANEGYHLREKTLAFRGTADKGRFKGLTIRAKQGAWLTTSFRINNKKDVGRMTILFLGGTPPAGPPAPRQ